MIRTETAKTITDTWYVHKITHNKYHHPQFFTTTVIHYNHIFIISIYYQYSFVGRAKDIETIITPSRNFKNVSQYYQDFTQITDEQVIETLKQRKQQ
ncbi:MAG: hypothetical protein ACRD6U_05865 [Nitrososphaeraceae archaeon]